MDDLHYTIMKTRHGAVMSPPSQNLYSETMPTPVAATTAAAEPSTAERRRRYIEDNTVPLGQRRETQPARLHVLNHDRPDRDVTELASFGPIGGYIRRCNVESTIPPPKPSWEYKTFNPEHAGQDWDDSCAPPVPSILHKATQREGDATKACYLKKSRELSDFQLYHCDAVGQSTSGPRPLPHPNRNAWDENNDDSPPRRSRSAPVRRRPGQVAGGDDGSDLGGGMAHDAAAAGGIGELAGKYQEILAANKVCVAVLLWCVCVCVWLAVLPRAILGLLSCLMCCVSCGVCVCVCVC